MDYMSYSELFSIRSMVETRIEKENIEMEIFAEKYGTKSTSHSKTFLIVWVAILTVFISLIHFSKKKLFSDHLLFSVELICFILHILTIAVGFLLFLIFKLTKQNYMDDSVIVFIYIPALAYFLFRSIKKFYGTSTVVAAFKSAASLIIVVLSIECYRLFLFMLTMYTL